MLKIFRKKLYVVFGSLFLVLGIIGIVVPILPTTPFLILTTVCYMKGSDRLYKWIIQNRLIGDFIKNYLEGKGISIKSKIFSISFLWLTILISSILFIKILAIQIILLIILIGVTLHILLIKTNKMGKYHNVKVFSK